MSKFLKTNLLSPLFNNPLFNDNLIDLDERYSFAPSVNITEDKNLYHIDVALPGVAKEDVKININKGILTIEGERKEELKQESAQYCRKEFHYGAFKRSFSVPEGVKRDDIKASYKDGVLSIALPKNEEEKQKSIAIS